MIDEMAYQSDYPPSNDIPNDEQADPPSIYRSKVNCNELRERNTRKGDIHPAFTVKKKDFPLLLYTMR